MTFNPEIVAYWYFRLNGFLTIQNFVVHPNYGTRQHTDADLLAVRFPYRQELGVNPMADEELFTNVSGVPFVAIVEVKQGRCSLNGAWTSRDTDNIGRVVRALGILPLNRVQSVVEEMYSEGCYRDESYYITLCCIGDCINDQLGKDFPKVPQVTWEEALRFIFNRFRDHRSRKSEHKQWDESGHILWKSAANSRNQEEFVRAIRILWKAFEPA